MGDETDKGKGIGATVLLWLVLTGTAWWMFQVLKVLRQIADKQA